MSIITPPPDGYPDYSPRPLTVVPGPVGPLQHGYPDYSPMPVIIAANDAEPPFLSIEINQLMDTSYGIDCVNFPAVDFIGEGYIATGIAAASTARGLADTQIGITLNVGGSTTPPVTSGFILVVADTGGNYLQAHIDEGDANAWQPSVIGYSWDFGTTNWTQDFIDGDVFALVGGTSGDVQITTNGPPVPPWQIWIYGDVAF